MTKLIPIFLDSGLGGVLRYALSGWVQYWTTESFPTGTLEVTVIGCLAIGFLSTAFTGQRRSDTDQRGIPHRDHRR